MKISLPISKSIANRILLLQAIHGDPLMRVSSDMPDDVLVLHDALEKIRELYGTPEEYASSPSPSPSSCGEGRGGVLPLKNCGTALRFLQVHIAKCYPDAPIVLTGDPRLMERNGKPTSQTTSARILHGEDIPVSENESPYITLSRRIKELYEKKDTRPSLPPSMGGLRGALEPDWSSAAFWYEYVAIHGGELLLEGLTENSLQGDRIVADLYAEYFGVQTEFVDEGAIIHKKGSLLFPPTGGDRGGLSIDFSNCPDLYPAIALTCERLGIELLATGTERLRFKESDRLEAVRLHEVRNDHRMAMALLVAGYKPLPASKPLSDSPLKGEGLDLQRIIAKSYPTFLEQFSALPSSLPCGEGRGGVITHITPIKGINDDHLGKKHALSKLIHAAKTEYVWLHDDDVIWPKAAKKPNLTFPKGKELTADLYILPLRMASSPLHGGSEGGIRVLEALQIAEYAAIQELTMRTAKRGHAVMCSGANLIVRREAWLACEADLHPEIPSGDDMFLLEAMKRRGMKIAVIDEPDYTAVVHAVPTWRAFVRQRMRWAGKAPKYTDRDILLCGALIVTINLLQILCPLLILIKFPIEYSLIKKRITPPFTGEELCSIGRPVAVRRTLRGVGLFYVALLLEILYPFYILLSLIGGLFRQKKW